MTLLSRLESVVECMVHVTNYYSWSLVLNQYSAHLGLLSATGGYVYNALPLRPRGGNTGAPASVAGKIHGSIRVLRVCMRLCSAYFRASMHSCTCVCVCVFVCVFVWDGGFL